MKSLFLFILTFIFALIVNAQSVDIVWSEPMVVSNGTTGHFREFIGANDSYVYALFYGRKNNGKIIGIRIVAYDRTTMKETRSIDIKGFQSKFEKHPQYKGKNFVQGVVSDGRVFFLWQVWNKKAKLLEFYVDAYDSEFNRVGELTKMLDVNKEFYQPGFMKDPREKGSVILCASEVNFDQSVIEFHFNKIDHDFVVQKSGTITNSFAKQEKVSSAHLISAKYDVTELGRVLVSYSLHQYGGINNHYWYGSVSNVEFDLEQSRKIPLYEKKEDQKDWIDVTRVESISKSYIFGLYRDPNKIGKDGRNLPHGVFLAERRDDSEELKKVKYSPFEAKMAKERIFSVVTPADQSKIYDYEVAFVKIVDGDVIAVCSEVVTGTSQNESQNTVERPAIFCIRMSLDGQIKWVSSIIRKTDNKDFSILPLTNTIQNGKLLMTYSYKNTKEKPIGGYLNYVIVNLENGSFKEGVYHVNRDEDDSKHEKNIEYYFIKIFDEQRFLDHSQKRLGTTTLVVGTVVMSK